MSFGTRRLSGIWRGSGATPRVAPPSYKQIDGAKGDNGILIKQRQVFFNEAAQDQVEQAKAEKHLKERLISINQPWVEQPSPPPPPSPNSKGSK